MLPDNVYLDIERILRVELNKTNINELSENFISVILWTTSNNILQLIYSETIEYSFLLLPKIIFYLNQ